LIGSAGKLDRPAQRAGPIHNRAPAARHLHFSKVIYPERGPRDPAAKGVALRDPVEDQLNPAGRIAAQCAQRHALAGGMSRARIRAAEELDSGEALKQSVKLPGRCLAKIALLNSLGLKHAFGHRPGQGSPGDDNRLLRRLRRGQSLHVSSCRIENCG
jgi:hypothetical protein